MKLFDFFKRTKPEIVQKLDNLSEKTAIDINSAIEKHKVRIANLNEELEKLSNHLSNLYFDENLTTNEKNKRSDNLIRRMALIKYEIGVREDTIKWLS